MEEPKFKIKPKKYNGASVMVSMRIPNDLLKDIDNVAKTTGRTRNELLVRSLEFALEHLEITDKD